jgi:hypothetical protein
MRTDEHSVIEDKSLPELELPDIRREYFYYVRYILIVCGLILILFAIFKMYRKWRANRKEKKQ